jgi:hypothetical protein
VLDSFPFRTQKSWQESSYLIPRFSGVLFKFESYASNYVQDLQRFATLLRTQINMSNDTSTLDPVQDAQLIFALELRARVQAHRENAKPLLGATRPQRPPPVTRILFDPNRTLQSEQQIDLYESWSLGGIDGLTKVVHSYVEQDYNESEDAKKDDDKKSTKDPHRFIRDDFEAGSPKMGILLMGMQRKVLDGLLNGNVAGRTYYDADFRAAVIEHTNLEALPCVYLLQIVRAEIFEGKPQTYPGRGLTWHEWKETIQGLREYEAEHEEVPTTDWVKQVDASFAHRGSKPYKKPGSWKATE